MAYSNSEIKYPYPIKSHIAPSKDFNPNTIITDDLCDTVFISSLLADDPYENILTKLTQYGLRKALANKCKVIILENTKDIWVREYMPVQITADQFWYFKYNPDCLQSKTNKIISLIIGQLRIYLQLFLIVFLIVRLLFLRLLETEVMSLSVMDISS